jgi:elongation factor Ts
MVTIDKIKQLREETGISISECKKALEGAKGNTEKAKEILRKWGKDLAKKKIEKETGQGIIESYIHPGKRIGVMIELRCQSDFVAKSEEFQKLAHELCLQIAAISPEEIPLGDEDKSSSSPFAVARVLEQPWIRDESKTVKDLLNEYIAKIGENIIIKRFLRYEI